MYLYNWKIRPLAIGHKAMGHKAAFCNNPAQTSTDHVPRPFSRPHKTKTGKSGLATRDYSEEEF